MDSSDKNHYMVDADVIDDVDFYPEPEDEDEDVYPDYAGGSSSNTGATTAFEYDLHSKHERNFAVLTETDIRQLMANDISQVSTVLSIPPVEASILLRHYNWSVSKVHDDWFSDESGVRRKVGLLENPKKDHQNDTMMDLITCRICYDPYAKDSTKSAPCGHRFCGRCWSLYVRTSVEGGPGCLTLRCPEPSCVQALGDDFILELISEDEIKDKYHRYLVRSYVEDSKRRKWCPAPSCEYAIDFVVGGDGNLDVSCPRSHTFCWNCVQEGHRPVDCETVAKWILKNESDSENDAWKKAYTKPCPKCSRPIEKNEGCMHMTCSAPCKFQFCWLCLSEWKHHGSRPCNGFQSNSTEAEPETAALRSELRRYQHYYDRWAANEKSVQIAVNDVAKVETELIQKLCVIQHQPQAQFAFLMDAWRQIVECRRVLKWTYAYGYYLPENEHAKKDLFEFFQGQAEVSLERLHHCAETEVKRFVEDGNSNSSDEFGNFRSELCNLTWVTKKYFQKLVTALENGLSEVTTCGSSSSSSKRKRKGREYTRMTGHIDGAERNVRAAAASGRLFLLPLPVAIAGPWACEFCGAWNPQMAENCQACRRGSWTCPRCTFGNPRTAATCMMCDIAAEIGDESDHD